MRSFLTTVLACSVLLAGVGHAAAQSAYVGASVLADVVRASGDVDRQPGSGEAIGGALRVGTSLGERWGVELEFTRSGDIEWRPDVTILAELTPTLTRILPSLPVPVPDIAIYPTPDISVESQLSTLTTTLWWRQHVTARFDLVYLGGAAFTRTKSESRVEYPQLALPGRIGQLIPTRIYAQETIVYDTGVTVGLDGSIGMTDHLRLVPGLRLVTMGSRWVIRPAVGLQWRF